MTLVLSLSKDEHDLMASWFDQLTTSGRGSRRGPVSLKANCVLWSIVIE